MVVSGCPEAVRRKQDRKQKNRVSVPFGEAADYQEYDCVSAFRLLTFGQLQPFLKTPQPLRAAIKTIQARNLKDLFIEVSSV